MLDDKIAQLVERLYDGTVKGNLQWEKTIKKGVYQTAFPESSIEISEREEQEDYPGPPSVYYILGIYNKDGVLIEQVSSGSLRGKLSEGQSSFEVMGGMYLNARRMAEGVENTVDAILNQLGLLPDEIDEI